jgi:methyl-accepting chemotaxis protein
MQIALDMAIIISKGVFYMFKNIKIGPKLIIIGAVLIAVPLIAVAYLSITRSTGALNLMEGETLVGNSSDLSNKIDTFYQSETRTALTLANNPVVKAAFVARTLKGPEAAAAEVTAANAQIEPFRAVKEIAGAYEAVNLVSSDGIVYVSSSAAAVGVDVTTREYYKTAMAGQNNVGSVTVSKVTGKLVTPIAVPVRVDGAVVGVVSLILKIDWLTDLVANEKVGKTGYAFIADGSGLMVAHPNAENILKLNISGEKGMELLARNMAAGKSGVEKYVYLGVAKTAGYAPVKSTGWSVAYTLPDGEYLAAANDIRNAVFLFGAVSLLVAILIYFLFSRTITKPLARGVAFARLVAAGDFTQQLDVHQKDEVGELVNALNSVSMKLRETVSVIQESAEQVAASSEQITATAQKLAEGAQSQASTLEETSASVEELTASVDQVAEHAQSQAAAVEQGSSSMAQVRQSIEQVSKNLAEIAGLAGKSVENALDGARAVSEVVEGINLIAGSSEKIGGIVTVISDIADQTNLLALNASIEAARAGEHGRGFAVVADEVSKLADRSSTSTKEIEVLIRESVKNVTKGVETARGSQTAMEQIRDASQKVKEMIAGLSDSMNQQVAAVKELAKALENVSEMSQSISAATEEQTTNAKQVSTAVENVNDVTQSAASASEEMSASTEELSGMAQTLQKLMGQFKINGARGARAIARAAATDGDAVRDVEQAG